MMSWLKHRGSPMEPEQHNLQKGKDDMLLNILIHEQSALERLRHQQCEGGQERMLAGLPRHRGSGAWLDS